MKDPVMVFYKFKNEEKAGLGMPLPAGNVRVYQRNLDVVTVGGPHQVGRHLCFIGNVARHRPLAAESPSRASSRTWSASPATDGKRGRQEDATGALDHPAKSSDQRRTTARAVQ